MLDSSIIGNRLAMAQARLRQMEIERADVEGEIRALRWAADQLGPAGQVSKDDGAQPTAQRVRTPRRSATTAASPRKRGNGSNGSKHAAPVAQEPDGERRPPIRREVLRLLGDAKKPLTDDELMDELRKGGPVVYRQLKQATDYLSKHADIVALEAGTDGEGNPLMGWWTPESARVADVKPLDPDQAAAAD